MFRLTPVFFNRNFLNIPHLYHHPHTKMRSLNMIKNDVFTEFTKQSDIYYRKCLKTYGVSFDQGLYNSYKQIFDDFCQHDMDALLKQNVKNLPMDYHLIVIQRVSV